MEVRVRPSPLRSSYNEFVVKMHCILLKNDVPIYILSKTIRSKATV